MANKKQKLLKGLLATAMITGAANSAMANDYIYGTNGGGASWNSSANLDVYLGPVGNSANAVAASAGVSMGGASEAGGLAPSILQTKYGVGLGTSGTFGASANFTDGGGASTATTAADTISLRLDQNFTVTTAAIIKDIAFTAAGKVFGPSAGTTVTGAVGSTNAGAAGSILFGGANTLKLTGASADLSGISAGASAISFGGSQGTLELNGGGASGAHQVLGAGISSGGAGASGNLHISGDFVELRGNLTNLAGVSIDAGKHAFFDSTLAGRTSSATTMTLGGANATAVFTAVGANSYGFSGNIVAGASNQGVVYTNGASSVTIAGNIGAGASHTAALVVDTAAGQSTTVTGPVFSELVQIGSKGASSANYGIGVAGQSANSVGLFADNVTAPVTFVTDGVFGLTGANKNLVGAVTTANGGSGTVYLGNGSTIATAIGTSDTPIKAVQIGGSVAVNVVRATADIYAQNVDFVGALYGGTASTSASVLQLGSAGAGKTISGNVINSSGAGVGILQVYNGSSVGGNIAAASNLAGLTFMETGATATVGGTSINAPINFGAFDSTLVLSSSAAANVAVSGGVSVTADNIGTIKSTTIPAGQIVTVTGTVGTSANGLKSIDVGAAKLVLSAAAANATVRNVNAAELTLLGAGSTHTIGNGTSGSGYGTSNGILNIGTNNLTIGASSNFANLAKVYFDANNVTTIQDGVNIVAASVGNATQGHGKLLFTGNATLDAKMTDRKIADISMGTTAASKVLKIKQDVVFGASNNTINFNGGASDAVIEIYGNVTNGGGIDVIGGTAGTFAFKNAKGTSITVTGDLSPTAKAQAVKIGDGNVTFTAVTNGGGASALTFTSTENKDATLTLKGNAPALGLITTAKDGYGIIEFDNDINTTGLGTTANSFGTSAAKLQALRLIADKTATIGASTTIYGDLRTSVDGKGTAVFNGVHEKVYGIGEKDKAYKAVSFDNDTTLLGDVYSKAATFGSTAAGASAKTLTLSAGLYSPLTLGTSVAANTVTLKATDKAIIGGAVTASASNTTITFDKSGEIRANLGDSTNAINVMNFSGASADAVKVGGDIFGKTINQTAGATVQLTKNAKFTVGAGSSYNVTGSAIDLQDKALTISGGALALDGKVVLNTAISLQDGETPTVGTLVLDSTASGIATAAATGVVNVTVTESADYLPKTGDAVTVLDATAATAAGVAGATNTSAMVNKFTTLTGVSNLGDFVKAGIETDGKTVKVALTRDVTALVRGLEALAGTDADVLAFARGLTNKENSVTGNAALLLARLNYMTAGDRQKTLTRLVKRVSTNTVAENVSIALADTVNAQLSGSMSSIGVIAPTTTGSADSLGASAGDEASAPSMGAWARVIGGMATQKMRKSEAGFKSQMQGGVIGFDTAVNDSTVVGVAAATANTTLKHKDAKAGDRTKATTYMFAVYGMREFGGNWIAQGNAMFGNTSIKNTEKRILARNGVTANATGKFDTMTYAMELLGGYRYNVSEGANVTPMAGLRYAKFNQGGYTETGAGYQNTTVSKKNTDKIEGVIGVRTDYTTQVGEVAVSPEAHAFINYDFKAKAAKVDVILDGYQGAITSQGKKPARISYNLGTSVMAKSGMVEYGVGYDAHLSDKYVGHQGAIKVRVNF